MPGSSSTLSGLFALKMEMGGLCDNPSHEPRFVDPDTPALIRKYGPDARTEDVMRKVTCSVCCSAVPMVISAVSARTNAPAHRRVGAFSHAGHIGARC